jgi:hypothetical protein
LPLSIVREEKILSVGTVRSSQLRSLERDVFGNIITRERPSGNNGTPKILIEKPYLL